MRKFVKKSNKIITDCILFIIIHYWSRNWQVATQNNQTGDSHHKVSIPSERYLQPRCIFIWMIRYGAAAEFSSPHQRICPFLSAHPQMCPPTPKIKMWFQCGRFKFSNYKLQVKPTKIDVLCIYSSDGFVSNYQLSTGSNGNGATSTGDFPVCG